MRRLRPVLYVVGVLALLIGALWIGQGLGYVRWPASSFMLDQRPWVTNGSVLAVIGLVMILIARRIRG